LFLEEVVEFVGVSTFLEKEEAIICVSAERSSFDGFSFVGLLSLMSNGLAGSLALDKTLADGSLLTE